MSSDVVEIIVFTKVIEISGKYFCIFRLPRAGAVEIHSTVSSATGTLYGDSVNTESSLLFPS